MRTTRLIPLLLMIGFCLTAPAAAAEKGNSTEVAPATADQIVDELEDRYGGKNFFADFRQESTLKAMDITDTASGNVWFKHPGMMRWEYKKPERHIIITDGKTLWIYRPADNQVVLGDAMSYFGNGKGASFLANFKLVKDSFTVTLDETADDYHRLKLVPREKQLDLSAIYINVDRRTFDINHVVSENVYGDITRIFFDNLTFNPDMDDALFLFEIPPNADIIEMDE